MEKFEEELKNAKNPWVVRIGNYLKSRNDLIDNLKKENKSLDECFRYVLYEISKKAERAENVGYAAGDDEIIYELAVHYYDEDEIKVPEKLNFRTNAIESKKTKENVDIQNKIDQAVNKAIEEYKQKHVLSKKRKNVSKKENDNQISLFDYE